jgi:hypothetical protein
VSVAIESGGISGALALEVSAGLLTLFWNRARGEARAYRLRQRKEVADKINNIIYLVEINFIGNGRVLFICLFVESL